MLYLWFKVKINVDINVQCLQCAMLIVDPKNYLYFSTLSSDIPTNEICYGNIELARILIILTDNV